MPRPVLPPPLTTRQQASAKQAAGLTDEASLASSLDDASIQGEGSPILQRASRSQSLDVVSMSGDQNSQVLDTSVFKTPNLKGLISGPPLQTSSRLSSPEAPSTVLRGIVPNNQTGTPIGAGIDTVLTGTPPDLPLTPSGKHLATVISSLAFEIKGWAKTCENEEGWIGNLEQNIAKYKQKIVDLKIKATTINNTNELQRLDEMNLDLDVIAQEKRKSAGTGEFATSNDRTIPPRPFNARTLNQVDGLTTESLNISAHELSGLGRADRCKRNYIRIGNLESELKAVRKNYEERCQQIEKEITNTQDTQDNFRKKVSEDKVEKDESIKRVGLVLSSVVDKVHENSAIIEELETLKHEYSKLQSEMEVLRSSHSKLQSEMENVTHGNLKLQTEVSDFKLKVESELQAINKAKSASDTMSTSGFVIIDGEGQSNTSGNQRSSSGMSNQGSAASTARVGSHNEHVAQGQHSAREQQQLNDRQGQGESHQRPDTGMAHESTEDAEVELDDDNRELREEADDLRLRFQGVAVHDLNKANTIKLYNTTRLGIETRYKDLKKSLDNKVSSQNSTLTSQTRRYVSKVIREAKEWCDDLIDHFNLLDCDRRPLDQRHFEKLQKFTRESEVNIFEFIAQFEVMTDDRGSQGEKAELLFTKYLGQELQDELIPYKNSYQLLKDKLIKECGNIKSMTENILKKVKELEIPYANAPPTRVTVYFRKLEAAMLKIEELGKAPGISKDSLKSYIYSFDFVAKVSNLLPLRIRQSYHEDLAKSGIDPRFAQGEEALTVLKKVINTQFMASKYVESACEIGGIKEQVPKRGKDKKDAPAKVSVHHQSSKAEARIKDRPDRSQYTFPCPMYPYEKHDHELGTCSKFLNNHPAQRAKEKGICWCCLGDLKKCKEGCVNIEAVRKAALLCTECVEFAEKLGKSPRNVLMCARKEHTKLSQEELIERLSAYLKDFDPSVIKKVKIAVNHIGPLVNVNCSKVKSRSRSVDSLEKTPNFNTEGGERVTLPENRIHRSPIDSAGYLLQTITLGDTDVLVMFDTGASDNVIDGEIAEKLKLKVTNSTPNLIGGVGGRSEESHYGTYKMSIGPDSEGMYYELIVHGMDRVTAYVDWHNLADLNEEVCARDPSLRYEDLPPYRGGTPIHLIIGMKNLNLQPKLLFQLESGVGVFRSVLKDKYSSNICYAGPHVTFNHPDSQKCNVNFTSTAPIEDSPLGIPMAHSLAQKEEDTPLGMLIDSSLNQDDIVNSWLGYTAVTEQDLKDMGLPVMVDTSDELVCNCNDNGEVCDAYVYKAKVPAAKRKQYIDAEDNLNSPMLRCLTCENCKCRLLSSKERMMSLQEQQEQEAIEKSVTIDIEGKKTYVELPFTTNPVKALKKRHKGADSNYAQALKIFKTQCNRPKSEKLEMVKVLKDLVDKGFITKLSDLPAEQKKVIDEAEFRHYMPWRSIQKPDSVSTPYRMVVDATCSGINEILAKGINSMIKTSEILIRSRTKQHIWSSDIKKMYNMLHLKDSALPYGLLLHSDDLSPDSPPETYVMLVAWYGVTSTGNQGGEALEKLARAYADECPTAFEVILKNRYVDDLVSGSSSQEEREIQIQETAKALSSGGFNLKYVVRSGEAPSEEASNDGTHVGILGYSWDPVKETLKPGFKELNFQKKKRGCKAPNPFPVLSVADIKELLKVTKVTRRLIIAKISEIYDPIGLWEAYKLQLKLDSKLLHKYGWDDELPEHIQLQWEKRFHEFLDIPKLSVARSVVPEDAKDPTKVRLLCFADAGAEAGGCVIYAGFERKSGGYSCQLLTARSRLMDGTVPRNELEAIKLMVEAAIHTQEALYDLDTEFHFFTDSTIALCWCLNRSKKLRMYTLNRVAEIRRGIRFLTDCDEDNLPLYHISGTTNPADMVTKPSKLTPLDIGCDSQWHNGLDWMVKEVTEMPTKSFADLQISPEDQQIVNKECYPKVVLSGEVAAEAAAQVFITKPSQAKPPLIDVVKLGWDKSVKVLSVWVKYIAKLRHKKHSLNYHENCILCKAVKQQLPEIEEKKLYVHRAKDVLYQAESSYLKKVLSKKELANYTEVDGILYAKSRLSKENSVTVKDLDFKIYFDKAEIKSQLPLVGAKSPLFFSYAMHIHNQLGGHSGVEKTMRNILLEMYPFGNARKILHDIRKDCPMCRLIAKKTQEQEMADHPSARTCIAPPFYHSQIDTVYGFTAQSFKNSRKTYKVYALVIVCLLTGATACYCIEGLETQDIVMALERHAARHGLPGILHVDNGTQLIALKNVEFDIRQVDTLVQESMGFEVRVSTAKSHEARGRVESRVKLLRDMLLKFGISEKTCMTALGWETVFAKIENQLNSLPMAKPSNSNVNDPNWELITPNRLLLGRNNHRNLEGVMRLPNGPGCTQILKKNESIQRNWYMTLIEHIHHLIPRPPKWRRSDKVNVGDVCLFLFNSSNSGKVWKVGRIVSIPAQGKVQIEYCTGKTHGKTGLYTLSQVVRSPRDISIIHAVDEININSNEYFRKITG